QLTGIVDGAAHGVAVDAFEDVFVVIVIGGLMTEDFRRDGPLRRNAAAVEKDADELLVVERDGDGAAQLARLLIVAADDIIQHVEAGVVAALADSRLQLDATLAHRFGQRSLAAAGQIDDLVETLGTDAGHIIVALQELVPVGNTLPLQAVDHSTDERHLLAGVVQQPSYSILLLAGFGIGLAVKVGVGHQLDALVGLIGHHRS